MTRDDKAKYTPTPAQIRERAARIRDGWSEIEERRRSCFRPGDLRVPEVRAVIDEPKGDE